MNNPQAQEKYQQHLANIYVSNLDSLRKKYKVSTAVPDEILMILQHFLGLGGTRLYLNTLMKTKSYDAAQKAVDDVTRKRLEKQGKKLPKNAPIVDYLEDFQNRLNSLYR